MKKIKAVIDYIETMKKQGFNDQQIKEKLKSAGWDEQTITNHFPNNDIPTPNNIPRPDDIPHPNRSNAENNSEELQHLNPKAVWLLATRYLGLLLVLVFFLRNFIIDYTTADGSTNLIFFFSIIIAYFVIAYIIATFEYKFYLYAVKKEGFYKEYGIISKKYVTIPYERIQNIDVHQSVLARILGLYSIKIQTAGNSGVSVAEGILPGVSKEEATRLRNELLTRAKNF